MQTHKQLKARASAFYDLHSAQRTFVMPCAWDAFSALLFERAGFQCLGTTSGGVNWVKGRKDYVYTTPADEMMRAYSEIANAVGLPVSADLENGYGGYADNVAATITASISAGMVGGSIEDTQVVPSDAKFTNGELYQLDVAVERIRAARAAADLAAFPYTLTGRCEVYYTSRSNPFAESVKRLNAYREAGADCLFVPGLNNLRELEQLVKEVNGPVNFGMGATDSPITVPMLEDIGVRRISTGGGLARATFGLLQNAAAEIVRSGSFDYLDAALSEESINKLLEQ